MTIRDRLADGSALPFAGLLGCKAAATVRDRATDAVVWAGSLAVTDVAAGDGEVRVPASATHGAVGRHALDVQVTDVRSGATATPLLRYLLVDRDVTRP